jgi:hypothetical protein
LWGFKDGIFQPDFESTANGKEQYKQAEDFTKQKLRGMLEQKTEVQPFQQPRAEYAPAYVYERGDKAKKDINAGNLIAKLYSGTPAEQQAAVTYFGGLPNVRSISRTNEGIVLTTTDGMTKPIPFINPATNQLMTQDDFVRSASSLLIGKDVDINKVLQGALSTGSKQFATGEASMTAESTNPNEMYAKYVSSAIPTLSTDETEAVTALAPILSRIGFSAREAKVGQDFVVIRNKDGVESEPIDLSDPASSAQSIQSFLLGNVPGKNEEERIMYLSGLAKKGALGGTQSAQKVVNPPGVGSKY